MSVPAPAPDLKERVDRILNEEIGPALQIDTGRIEVLDVTDGVARVRLQGVCTGCPSTGSTSGMNT